MTLIADHVLIGVIVASDDRQFLHVETGLLQFLDGRFSTRVRRIDCHDEIVFVHDLDLGFVFVVRKISWATPGWGRKILRLAPVTLFGFVGGLKHPIAIGFLRPLVDKLLGFASPLIILVFAGGIRHLAPG